MYVTQKAIRTNPRTVEVSVNRIREITAFIPESFSSCSMLLMDMIAKKHDALAHPVIIGLLYLRKDGVSVFDLLDNAERKLSPRARGILMSDIFEAMGYVSNPPSKYDNDEGYFSPYQSGAGDKPIITKNVTKSCEAVFQVVSKICREMNLFFHPVNDPTPSSPSTPSASFVPESSTETSVSALIAAGAIAALQATSNRVLEDFQNSVDIAKENNATQQGQGDMAVIQATEVVDRVVGNPDDAESYHNDYRTLPSELDIDTVTQWLIQNPSAIDRVGANVIFHHSTKEMMAALSEKMRKANYKEICKGLLTNLALPTFEKTSAQKLLMVLLSSQIDDKQTIGEMIDTAKAHGVKIDGRQTLLDFVLEGSGLTDLIRTRMSEFADMRIRPTKLASLLTGFLISNYPSEQHYYIDHAMLMERVRKLTAAQLMRLSDLATRMYGFSNPILPDVFEHSLNNLPTETEQTLMEESLHPFSKEFFLEALRRAVATDERIKKAGEAAQEAMGSFLDDMEKKVKEAQKFVAASHASEHHVPTADELRQQAEARVQRVSQPRATTRQTRNQRGSVTITPAKGAAAPKQTEITTPDGGETTVQVEASAAKQTTADQASQEAAPVQPTVSASAS